jgi:hypothetical protein
MASDFDSMPQTTTAALSIPILNHKMVKKCHVVVPDLAKPVGAIAYEGKFYSYFRCYEDPSSARRTAARLLARGDLFLLTQVRRGLILWVFEPDAKLAAS